MNATIKIKKNSLTLKNITYKVGIVGLELPEEVHKEVLKILLPVVGAAQTLLQLLEE